jgi:hypothetical protein
LNYSNNQRFSKFSANQESIQRLSNHSIDHEYDPERALPMDPRRIRARIFNNEKPNNNSQSPNN